MILKPPSKLTKTEALAELETLKADVEFTQEWTSNTPLKTLQLLVKEGRGALKEADSTTDEANAIAASGGSTALVAQEEAAKDAAMQTGLATNPPEIKRERPIRKTSFTITAPDGSQRTYSEYTHGKLWETLARQYAGRVGGTIE